MEVIFFFLFPVSLSSINTVLASKHCSICHTDSGGVLLNAFCDSKDCTYTEVVCLMTAERLPVLQHVLCKPLMQPPQLTSFITMCLSLLLV